MKIINEFTYSKTPFEGWKFRVKFKFSVDEDWRNDSCVDIYTNNHSRISTLNDIENNISKKVIKVELIHWSSKEEDELTDKFIEETLKDI